MTEQTLPPGPLMMDVQATRLSHDDRDLLRHPIVGGVVLFSRNYENPQQLRELITDMRRARPGPLLISVDHEGGRVQRFRDGFSRIPAMRQLGLLYDQQPQTALQLAADTGWLLASELGACGIDFSFTPVVDIDRQLCDAIGDRALHRSPLAVSALAAALLAGLHRAGFAGVIKHYPGHGGVSIDSHLALPRDARPLEVLEEHDILPFRCLCQQPRVAVMPGHVVYPLIDPMPASLSPHWLQQQLRGELGFNGPIISDDLHMNAATDFAGPNAAAPMAQSAGCDLLLVCNDRPAVIELLDSDALVCGDSQSVKRRLSLCARNSPTDEAELQRVQQRVLAFAQQHS